MRALFVLPFAASDAPAWLRHALEVRAIATIVGACPGCGATYDRAEVRPGEIHTPAMFHEYGCPAGDTRLRAATVLPEWVELRLVAIDMPDEEAVA